MDRELKFIYIILSSVIYGASDLRMLLFI